MKALLLAAALLGQCEELCPDERVLPVVVDEVDLIALVHRPSDLQSWPTLVFCHHGKKIDTRVHSDSMVLMPADDGRWLLIWEDWDCHRMVYARTVGIYEIEPLEFDDCQPWWVAPVLGLKVPPVQP